MGETTETEQKSYGEHEYKVLVYQCIKCLAYTDYLKNDMCLWCGCHPWTWDLTIDKKRKKSW
jgi:hypothetical protein